ncbi:MAG TPA: cytochrome c biogenesis protein ResB [Terriglobales bacterium]
MAFNLPSITKRLYKTLANLRTGIVLLILVGIAAALGTIILQRPVTEADQLARTYSPTTLQLLDRLTLTDVFHSWWFLTLLTLLSMSIVFVSVDRFPNAWRFYARPYRKTDSHFRAANPVKVELPIRNASDGINTAERVMMKLGWPVERISDGNQVSLYSERHRFSVMAVYLIHASLLLIFLGGIIDGIFGYSGYLMLQKGQTGNVIETRTGAKKTLPFGVKCYSAGQENYADGSPKKWWSNLAVVENGKEVKKKEIVVNDPLVYRGLRFYQASYGMTGALDALKVVATPEGGAGREVILQMGEPFDLDSNTSVTVAEFIPDFFIRDNQVFKKSDNPENPAFRLQIKNKAGGEDAVQWIFPAYNEASQGQKSNYTFQFRGMQMGYFTGLEVSHEPGQWLVWAGCVLMGFGLFVAFYMVHMRLWVVAIPDAKGKLVLWIGGQANKNKDRFEQKFKDVVEGIRTELESASTTPRSAHKDEPELTLAAAK